MSRVLPNLFYDIKYAVGGVERGVDACFVGKTQMVRGSHEPNVLCCVVCAVPTCRRRWRGSLRLCHLSEENQAVLL